MSLSSLSKLVLVLHPTHCSAGQDISLLLYSSVIQDEIWHLSLIGPAIPETLEGPQQTWWEGKWSMEDLQKVAPSKSPDELVEKIRSSFSKDDIALKGYREGNEAEIRVTIGYSTSEAFTVPLARLSPACNQKPFLNLLDITCEAYRQLESREHAKDIQPAQSRNALTQASGSAPASRTAAQKMQRTASAQALFARNLANPKGHGSFRLSSLR